MKPQISSRWTAPVLAGIGCLLIHPLFAQTLTTLHALTQPGIYPPGTNDEGSTPKAKLLGSNKTLYGTAAFGGSGGYGTIFKMSLDGTGFVILHSFEPIANYSNSEGGMPYAGLTLSGDTLYGEALLGGPFDCGTLFKLNTNGTDYTVLYSFTGRNDSSGPLGGLVQSGNTLYGTTAWFGGTGGYSQSGTVIGAAMRRFGWAAAPDGCARRNWAAGWELGLRGGQQSHCMVRAAPANRPAITPATGECSTTTVQMTNDNDKIRPQCL
jgi:uncharacterized repeat protein (TIGR03803 family)